MPPKAKRPPFAEAVFYFEPEKLTALKLFSGFNQCGVECSGLLQFLYP